MADQIVSWGGFNSKSTAGMGITGSFQVSSSANSYFVGGGNVGIGTSTPTASLDVRSAAASTGVDKYTGFTTRIQNTKDGDSVNAVLLLVNQNGGNGGYYIRGLNNQQGEERFYVNGNGGIYSISNGTFVGNVQATQIRWNTDSDGWIGDGGLDGTFMVVTNGIERYRINSSGNLLLGTTTNSARLTIQGSGATSSTTALLVQNANASASFSVRDDQSIIINGSSSMTVSNSGSALTITRTGNYDNIGSKPLLNIIDSTGGANVSKTGLYISTTGASANRAIEAYGGVGFGITPSDNQFQVAYPTQITNTVTAVSSNNNYVLTLKSLTSFATNAGTGISFWGDDRGQGGAISAFAGIRGVKENATYLNSLGNLVFYVQTGSAGGSTETTYREAARFNSSGSFGIGTSTPSASLHISGSSNSTLLEIDSPAVNNILYVSGSGNVGIGTGTPTATLHVSGSGRFTNGLTVSGSINMTGSYSLRGGNGSFVSAFNYTSSGFDGVTFYNFNDQYLFANPGNNSITNFYNITPTIAVAAGTEFGNGSNANGVLNVNANYIDNGGSRDAFQTLNQIRIAPSVSNYRYFYGRAIYFAPTLTSVSAPDFRFLENTTGDSYFNTTSGVVNIGSTTGLGARLGVKGTGTTSSTTSFLVQNANASSSLSVKDGISESSTNTGKFQVIAGNWTETTPYTGTIWRTGSLATVKDIIIGSDGVLNGSSSRLNFLNYYNNGGQGPVTNFSGYLRTSITQYKPGGTGQDSGRGILVLGVYDTDYDTTLLNSFDVVSVGKYATTISGSLTISGSGILTGNLTITGSLLMPSGSNTRVGSDVLTAGSVLINNTTVTANSLIFVTPTAAGTLTGTLRITAIVPSTSFTVSSTSITDTAAFSYFIVN
jgi:hypothetical protein